MRKARIAVAACIVAAGCLTPAFVYAQATRTWVSGVGDDVNPCSRTAPCKTFAGAISKTATNGEIDTLDPGGYGALTITKSITIDGLSGLAGVLVNGTNGLLVSAPDTAVVILRNLDINGIGGGLNGVRIISAGDVRIENCKIYGFTQRGIVDERSAGHLAVSNTVVSNNTQTGILTMAGGASTLTVTLSHVEMHSNGNSGLAVTGGTRAIVIQSSATSNGHGFYADTNAILNLQDSVAFGNSGYGVMSLTGAMVRLSNVTVSDNATGIWAGAGANIISYGSNRIGGNAAGNGPANAMWGVQ